MMIEASSKKLRVLRISHSAVLDTHRERERALLSLFPVELRLVIPKSWPELGCKRLDNLAESFEIERAGTFGTGSVPLFAFDPFPLIRALRRFKPQIIDIHEEPYSVSGFECAWLSSLFAPQAACIFYTAQNIQKKYPPPFSWMERFVYSYCKAAYPCSTGAQAVLRKKGFEGAAPVIPLGVNPDLFKQGSLSETERSERRRKLGVGQFAIGFIGRVEEYKGITVLLKALANLPSEIDWTLLVAGSGQFQPEAGNRSDQLKISQRIRWLGEVPAGEMPLILNLCDVVVIPSLTTRTWKEQFGRVAVEAMACGVPVIVSDSGSLPEVVNGTGLIVPEGNSDAIADKILGLYTDHTLRSKLSSRGIEQARLHYSWEVVASRMFKLYSQAGGSLNT